MIAVIGGSEKTGKTTMAMTFPKPMGYIELDIGGFDRAKVRFSAEELRQISLVQFPPVFRLEFRDRTKIETLLIRGERERWRKFITEFNRLCSDASVKTIVIDTWFQLYELTRQAYLQTLQEAQLGEGGQLLKGEIKLREALQQVEYTQPYSRLRNIMFYARGTGKNLVLVTYDADEYKPQLGDDGKIRDIRTGKKIMAGWKETEKHVDISLWTSVDGTQPIATITLPGLVPIEMVGVSLPDNSYSTLMQMVGL